MQHPSISLVWMEFWLLQNKRSTLQETIQLIRIKKLVDGDDKKATVTVTVIAAVAAGGKGEGKDGIDNINGCTLDICLGCRCITSQEEKEVQKNDIKFM